VQVHPLTGERAIILGAISSQAASASVRQTQPSVAMLQDHVTRAGKHGALALVCGRCGDLGQPRDQHYRQSTITAGAAHRASRDIDGRYRSASMVGTAKTRSSPTSHRGGVKKRGR